MSKTEKEDKTASLIELKDLFEGLSQSNVSEEDLPPSSTVELTHEIVETMFDQTKLKMITDLNELEIKGILKLSIINEIIFDGKTSVISKMRDEIMLLKISKNRGGRREMIKAIYSGSGAGYEEPVNRFKRFIG
jgi:hypothetical protein